MIQNVKFFVKKVLCSEWIGRFLLFVGGNRIRDLRWIGYRFVVPDRYVRASNVASIFWGFYEAEEIRCVHRFLSDAQTVVELGASLGIVSSHIVSGMKKSGYYLGLEANPYLIETVEANLRSSAPDGVVAVVKHGALEYDNSSVSFNISRDNTESQLGDGLRTGEESVLVHGFSLEKLVTPLEGRKFHLVSDIEGAEIQWILNSTCLSRECQSILVELHAVEYQGTAYDPERMLELLKGKGFKLVHRKGFVCYLINANEGERNSCTN